MNSINKIIKKLGIPTSFLGYKYLAFGVDLCIKDPSKLKPITKRLYSEIADNFEVTQTSMERDLRTAILKCWDHGDRALLQKIAQRRLFEKPSTAEFFGILTDYFRETNEPHSNSTKD